jgi:hypothetical protein
MTHLPPLSASYNRPTTYIFSFWGHRVVQVIVAVAFVGLVYFIFKKTFQAPPGPSPKPASKLTSIKKLTQPPCVKKGFEAKFGEIKTWVGDQINELSTWNQDRTNQVYWTTRARPLHKMRKETEEKIEQWVGIKTEGPWATLQKGLTSSRQEHELDQTAKLKASLETFQTLILQSEEEVQKSLREHLCKLEVYAYPDLCSFLDSLKGKQPDGDCFGMLRDNFFKVGLYKLCDLNSLGILAYENDLERLRQEIAIIEWATEEFVSMIAIAKRDAQQTVEKIQTQIQKHLDCSGQLKEDVATPLKGMQNSLKNLTTLLAHESVSFSNVCGEFNAFVDENKKWQAAMIKSYILQVNIQSTWQNLFLPSLADYCQKNNLTDPLLLYNLGAAASSPGGTTRDRLI